MVNTNTAESQALEKNYSVLNKYDWAWDLIESNPKLDQKAGLTFVALVHYANLKTGAAFPARQRLLKRSKNSESSLRRALSYLKKLGLVEESQTYRPEKYTTGAPSKGWKVNFPWLGELPASVTDNPDLPFNGTDNYQELPVNVTALNGELPVNVNELPVNVTGSHYIREQELTRKEDKQSSSSVDTRTTTREDDEILQIYEKDFKEIFDYFEEIFPGDGKPNFFGCYSELVDLINMDQHITSWNQWQRFVIAAKDADDKGKFFMACLRNEADKGNAVRYPNHPTKENSYY